MVMKLLSNYVVKINYVEMLTKHVKLNKNT